MSPSMRFTWREPRAIEYPHLAARLAGHRMTDLKGVWSGMQTSFQALVNILLTRTISRAVNCKVKRVLGPMVALDIPCGCCEPDQLEDRLVPQVIGVVVILQITILLEG